MSVFSGSLEETAEYIEAVGGIEGVVDDLTGVDELTPLLKDLIVMGRTEDALKVIDRIDIIYKDISAALLELWSKR